MSDLNIVKWTISLLSTSFIYLFGEFDIALQTLLLFIVFDYITGMMKSYKSSILNSHKGIKGILKKIGLLLLVAVSYKVDQIAGDSGLIRTTIIYYLAANEGLSILENLAQLGIVVPDFLKERLEQLRDKGDQN